MCVFSPGCLSYQWLGCQPKAKMMSLVVLSLHNYFTSCSLPCRFLCLLELFSMTLYLYGAQTKAPLDKSPMHTSPSDKSPMDKRPTMLSIIYILTNFFHTTEIVMSDKIHLNTIPLDKNSPTKTPLLTNMLSYLYFFSWK